MFSKDHILSYQKKGLEVRETQGEDISAEASTAFEEGNDKDLK